MGVMPAACGTVACLITGSRCTGIDFVGPFEVIIATIGESPSSGNVRQLSVSYTCLKRGGESYTPVGKAVAHVHARY